MQIYSFLRAVFLLTFCYQSVLPVLPAVKVEYNGTAVLPCSGKCSGLASWTMSQNPTDPLAECDQNSCRSVKEGYQMIYNQYLQGDFSLIITEADFSKRGLYICNCDGTDLYDVQLQSEAPEFSQHIKAGESLTLDFPVSEPVKVMFSRTGGTNADPVTVFEGRKVHCDPAYEGRAVFGPQLKEMKISDSGVYTLVDTKNEEVVSIYRITVMDEGKRNQEWNFWEKYKFYIGLGVGGIGVLLWFLLPPHIVRLWRRLKRGVPRLRGAASDADAGGSGQSTGAEHNPLKEPA